MSKKTLRNNRFSISGNTLLKNLEQKNHHIPVQEAQVPPPAEHILPSGHNLTINFSQSIIDVTTPDGQPTVHIELKPDGPVVEVAGARLSLKSPKDIEVSCENFSVNTEKDLYMNANGGLIIESTQELQLNCEVDIHIRAKVIWLN
jgi:hypothetical protein